MLYIAVCVTLHYNTCYVMIHYTVSPPSSPESSEHSSQQQQHHMKAKHQNEDDDKQWSGWRHGVEIPQARDSLLGQTLQAPLHAAATGIQPDAEVIARINT
jgi:hypothetical protein